MSVKTDDLIQQQSLWSFYSVPFIWFDKIRRVTTSSAIVNFNLPINSRLPFKLQNIFHCYHPAGWLDITCIGTVIENWKHPTELTHKPNIRNKVIIGQAEEGALQILISLLKQSSATVRGGNAPLLQQILSGRNACHWPQRENIWRKLFKVSGFLIWDRLLHFHGFPGASGFSKILYSFHHLGNNSLAK